MAPGAGRSALRYFIFTSFYLCLILLVTNHVSAAPTNGLYTDRDNVLILNQSNFAESFYNKDRAFILEFYNSYCGHCQRYAPTWVSFAGDIKPWNKVVAPAVLDCSDSANIAICQDYDIAAFPTIKHFWTYATNDDKGESVPHKDVETVRHSLIDFLVQNAKDKGAPDTWPHLLPVSGSSIADIWKVLPKEITDFYLIVEEPGSYVGAEVILDFSATDVRVLRISKSNAAALQDFLEISSYPALVYVNKNDRPKLSYTSLSAAKARKEIQKVIEDETGIHIDSGTDIDDHKKDGDDSVKPVDNIPVHMVDMENALHNILVQEVALKKELSGQNFSAFKSFLAALTKTFPGRPPVMKFLQELYNWILKQSSPIDMDEMQRVISDSQSSDSYLPDMGDWVGCKGSSPKYRGYSCGLWTLFHTMTVQAYNNYLEGESSTPREVLFAIHNYVYNFFGCTECSQHFHSMATDLELKTPNANDTVFWLWRAHNEVNRRLKGDATEDPAHPKIQFPSSSLCHQCRNTTSGASVNWYLPGVLRFLTNFYGRSQISMTGVVPFKESRVTREPKKQMNKFPSVGWNFRYFTGLDISLCVLLYLFSMLLLVVVFLVFTFRRKRLKRRHCFSNKPIL